MLHLALKQIINVQSIALMLPSHLRLQLNITQTHRIHLTTVDFTLFFMIFEQDFDVTEDFTWQRNMAIVSHLINNIDVEYRWEHGCKKVPELGNSAGLTEFTARDPFLHESLDSPLEKLPITPPPCRLWAQAGTAGVAQ